MIVARGRVPLDVDVVEARRRIRQNLSVRDEMRHLSTGLPTAAVTGFVIGRLLYGRPRLARGDGFSAGELLSLSLRGRLTGGSNGTTLSYMIARPLLSMAVPMLARRRQRIEREVLEEWCSRIANPER